MWQLQPSLLITAHGPSTAREHVLSLNYRLIIQELVSAGQRRLQSSYIENSGARCWNNLPLRASKFSQLMGQKLLQAKAPFVPLLNCLSTLILDWVSIILLSKLGNPWDRFLLACFASNGGDYPGIKIAFLKSFLAKLSLCSSKLPGMLPSPSPSCAGRDLVSGWAV